MVKESVKSNHKKSYRKDGIIDFTGSIRQNVFKLLDKNPLLTAKGICRILQIPYYEKRNYIYKLKNKWKFLPRNERGSIPSSIHGYRAFTYVSQQFMDLRIGNVRSAAISVGWIPTKAKNRWLLWKDRLGRLNWFETGRINLWIRSPANLGRAFQLICNAFSFTGLITDLKFLEPILKKIKFKSAHYVFDVKQPLPKLTIDLFGKSNGLVIKVGDRTHPTSLELIASFPDWADRNEKLLGDFLEVMNNFMREMMPEKFKVKETNRGFVV